MGTKTGLKGTSMIQVSPGNFIPVSNFAGSSTTTTQRPSGIGSAGTPLNLSAIQQSYGSTFPMDLAYMDMLEDAADKEEFKMQGVTDGPTLEQRQLEAAQAYANLVKSFPTTAQEIADVQAAKAKLVELNVSREQIEAQGIDASQGISGVMGPSISGVASQIGQGAIDLIGDAGQGFSDLITLGTGPEVAQTLLDPVSILLGGLGGTINYGQSGTTTPLIVGKTTKTGMPVGINIPDPRSIFEGGLGTLIPGAAGVAGAAGVLNTLGNQDPQDPSDGVGVTPAAVLTAATAADDDDSDAPKIGDPNGDSNSSGGSAALDQLPPVDRVSLPEAQVAVDRVSLPEAQVAVDRVSLPEAQVAVERTSLPEAQVAVERTSLPEAVIEEILANERTDPTRTSLPEPTKTSVAAAGGGGGGGGGGGTTAPSGGIRTVSGGPGPSVDIDYLYDFAKGLEQPFQATEEEEEDIVRAAEGGMIGNTDDFERILRILRGG